MKYLKLPYPEYEKYTTKENIADQCTIVDGFAFVPEHLTVPNKFEGCFICYLKQKELSTKRGFEDRKNTYIGIPKKDGKIHIGRASCSPEDAFDKTKGKNIAYGRANSKPQWTIVGSTHDEFYNFVKTLNH
jgi:hypothetical protein